MSAGDDLAARAAALGGGAPGGLGGGESLSSSFSFDHAPGPGAVSEGGSRPAELFRGRFGGLASGLRDVAQTLAGTRFEGGLSSPIGLGSPEPLMYVGGSEVRGTGASDGERAPLWKFDGQRLQIDDICFAYVNKSGQACRRPTGQCQTQDKPEYHLSKKIRGRKDPAFRARVEGHPGFFVQASEREGRILWERYFEGSFVDHYGLEDVTASAEDWAFLHEEVGDREIGEEVVNKAVLDFQQAQGDEEFSTVREEPDQASPYLTPGSGTTPAAQDNGRSLCSELNAVKARLRTFNLRMGSVGTLAADAAASAAEAVASAATAVSAVASAEATANAASSAAGSALTTAQQVGTRLSAAAVQWTQTAQSVMSLTTVLNQVVTAVETLQRAPGASGMPHPGGPSHADLAALRTEIIAMMEREAAVRESAFELVPGVIVADLNDAKKFCVVNFPGGGTIIISLLPRGFWGTFDGPTSSTVSAATITKSLKAQQDLKIDNEMAEFMASAHQEVPRDLGAKLPTEEKVFDKAPEFDDVFGTNQYSSIWHRCTKARQTAATDLGEKRRRILAHHPVGQAALQSMDAVTSNFIPYIKVELMSLHDQLLSKQCGGLLCPPEVKAEVWKVTAGAFWAVFEKLREIRSPARAMSDPSDAVLFNATFLLTAVRECELLLLIMSRPLREWPPIGASIMRYLFDNSISLTLFRQLESKAAETDEKVERLVKADKTREGHITALQKAVKK